MKAIADHADSLTITMTETQVTLDAGAMSTAAESAGSGDVSLSVTEYDKTAFSSDVQKIIGDRPVYELSLKAGDTELHELGGKATVSLPYTPKDGEQAEFIVIWRMVEGVPQPIACKYDAETGLATFETKTFSLYTVAYFPFNDIPTNSWYYANAVYAYQNGLMKGVGKNSFGPGKEVNRAMLVTILYRLNGAPSTVFENRFSDVPAGKWYSDAVIWAAENKIASGYGKGKFGALDTLTREQMVTMLYRYAGFMGYDVSKSADLSGFVDADKISKYALPAMKWAVAEGIVQGVGGNRLDASGDTNRAQIAAVMERFIEKYER